MNDLFDGVIYAGIDTDKHKYPIGKKVFFFCDSVIISNPWTLVLSQVFQTF